MNENDTLNEDLQRLTEALVDLQAQLLQEVATTLKAQAAENATLRADAERLEWMQFHGARIAWGNDGEVCSCVWPDQYHGDGGGETGLFDDWRAAIDAARGTTPAETLTEIDGCSEENCRRCRTAPNLRGNMAHAGIGSYPSAMGKT